MTGRTDQQPPEPEDAAAQRERDDEVRRDAARARAEGVDPTIVFVRELGFEELLED